MNKPCIITHDKNGHVLKEGDYVRNVVGDTGKVIITEDTVSPLKIEWTDKKVDAKFKHVLKVVPIDNVTDSPNICIYCGAVHAWYDAHYCRKCWLEVHDW